jgi:4'-phosphopantetheinyl transferase EntD
MGASCGYGSDHCKVNPEAFEAQFRAWFGPEAGVSAARIQGERDLFPEEQSCVASAVPKRRAEFSTGRWCARQALQALSLPPQAIPMGAFRGPVWPAGTSGSITHAGGICVAVVARSVACPGLGIDILETAVALPIVAAAETILDAPGDDLALSMQYAVDSRVLRFSAKESVIKAVSARMGRWVDFTEICVRFDSSSFQASVAGYAAVIPGRWALLDEFLLTAAWL